MASSECCPLPTSSQHSCYFPLSFSHACLNFGWLPLTKAGGEPRNPHVCSRMWEGDVVSDLGRGTTLRKRKEKAVSEKGVSSWKVGKQYGRWGFLFICFLFIFIFSERWVRSNYQDRAKEKKNLLMGIPDAGKMDRISTKEVTGKSRSMWGSRGQPKRRMHLLLY